MSKVITSYEINLLAKEASEKFLKSKISMNETISKIALEHDLNFEQAQRLAEESNTNVYLSLFHNAKPEDRYIEFEVADIKKIASVFKEKSKTAGLVQYFPHFSDYFLPPNTSYIPAPSQAKEELDKTASIRETAKNTEPPLQGKYAEQFKKLHEQAQAKLHQNSIYEIGFAVEKQANYLVDLAKQDILSKSGKYEELEAVFKTALSSQPKVAEYLCAQLPKLESTSKVAGVINKNHWFYKEVEKLGALLTEYETAKQNPGAAHQKIASGFRPSLGLGLGIGVPVAAVGALTLHEHHKTKTQMQNSPLTLQNPAINKVN